VFTVAMQRARCDVTTVLGSDHATCLACCEVSSASIKVSRIPKSNQYAGVQQ
jgi:hypothetical protein